MLAVHNLTKSYHTNLILTNVTFTINPGERVGLIGPNGSGKTTLLRILNGDEVPDAGLVTRNPVDLRLGYLPQGFEPQPGMTFSDAIYQVTGDPRQIETQLARLADDLVNCPGDPDLQADYDVTLDELERALKAYSSSRVREIIDSLGIADIPDDQPVSSLSGGQKTRLALARVLIGEPQLLLLDEPTNHLDIRMLEWLENWLSQFQGAALIVSHDRTFLDHTVNRIIDLNAETHTTREYAGNYSDYLLQYQSERVRLEAAYKDQVYEIRKMKQDITETKQQALRVELTTTSRQPGVRRYAKKVAKKAKSREKKLARYLETDERLEKPNQSWQMKLDFEKPTHLSRTVLTTEDLVAGYPGFAPLVMGLNLHIHGGDRIVLTGPNGTGKTTLLRTIAGQIPPLHGSLRLSPSTHLGYMSQEGEDLDLNATALDIIQASAAYQETEARAFLHYFLFSGDDPLRPISNLSYGERTRLKLATLVAGGCNFLLLDEPINHLDIPSRTRFERSLAGFDGTVLAVVHDRYFIRQFATELWILENHTIRRDILSG
jgi:ATP-binding cassette subfamily F protein 3